jgi:hypothetical protein
MAQDHPITPLPEMVKEWAKSSSVYHPGTKTTEGQWQQRFARQSAQWGADQELEACCEWLQHNYPDGTQVAALWAARRPNPPTLKEQALDQLRRVNAILQFQTTGGETSVIRRALEAIDD